MKIAAFVLIAFALIIGSVSAQSFRRFFNGPTGGYGAESFHVRLRHPNEPDGYVAEYDDGGYVDVEIYRGDDGNGGNREGFYAGDGGFGDNNEGYDSFNVYKD